MDLPDEAGFRMTRCITADLEGVHVILIGLAISFGEVLQAAQSGARGILSRAETVTQLGTAVKAVAAGGGYLGFRQAADLFALLQHTVPSAAGGSLDEQRRWHVLSLGEKTIIRLLCQGLSNAEIAAELCVTESTVKTHISNLLIKLRLRDRLQVVVAVYRNVPELTMWPPTQMVAEPGTAISFLGRMPILR